MPELSALRLVKVPDAAPPFDCETHGALCPARAGAAATDAETAVSRAAVAGAAVSGAADTAASGASVAGAAASQAAASSLGPGGLGSSGSSGSFGSAALASAAVAADPATARPRQLAVVVVEVLAGVRPHRQLVPLATDRVRARIRSLAPLLACDQRPRVTRIVTSRPAAQVVEMTVVVNVGPRSRALALRFEHVSARPAAPGWPARPARWLCTAIEAG